MRLRFVDMMACMMAAGFVLWIVFWTGSVPETPALSGSVRHVVDGDSLYMNGHEPQIRLWGVDAPERDEAGFQAATDALHRLAEGKQLTCQQIDRDQYGRTVARCFLSDGQEINRMMIESGTATEYLRFSRGFYSRG